MDELDETDKSLLRLLQENAKATTKELAAELHLTISPVYERIKRLENLGYIKQYVAVLNKNKIKKPVTVYCQVSMRYHTEAFIENFEEQIQRLEEVQECYHMAGQVDFLLKINVSSIDDYHEFVKVKLSKIENLSMFNSTFVLKEIKHTHAYSIL